MNPSPRATPILAAILLLGCPAERPDDTAAEPPPPANADPANDAAVCLRGEPFVAAGDVPVPGAAEAGDAAGIGALRWNRYEGCERFVIDLFAAGGSPAERVGPVSAEVRRELGVVRVALPRVTEADTDAADEAFDGPLAAAAYAVRSPEDRSVFVDLHLAGAAEAHVTTLESPARVVVDLRPGGPAVPGPAARNARVVVLEPRPGAASYPLTVTGYARTFEANVVVRIERQGEQVFEDFTTATDWVDAWGHYSLTIDEGPTGAVVLHVGEYSARDGAWEGVAIELHMR